MNRLFSPHRNNALQTLYNAISQTTMVDEFALNPRRFEQLSLTEGELLFDFSKNLINEDILQELIQWADDRQLSSKIDALFKGESINTTEFRPALHTAVRDSAFLPLEINGEDISASIRNCRFRMRQLVQQIESRNWRGYSQMPITDVVNIGIGGSSIGPQMVCHALEHFRRPQLKLHFVSNVDYNDLGGKLAKLNPNTTLFVVSSKSWTTVETLTNATKAKHWLVANLGSEQAVSRHFIAITAKPEKALDFGIPESNVLPMWDWIGGRYSLWSAIGLPIALSVGIDAFESLLQGAHDMDRHFLNTDFRHNMPVIMGLIALWYSQFFDARTYGIFPYSEHLELLPQHLQQLMMESNGKSTSLANQPVDYNTGPVLWGSMGTQNQHTYFQLLHQGTQMIPCDFIAVATPDHKEIDQHLLMLANCLAQSEALLKGKPYHQAYQELIDSGMNPADAEALAPHKTFAGNRPSNTLLLNRLTPYSLGQLLALYEHRTAVEAFMLDINAFDQWGVELGKTLCTTLHKELGEGSIGGNHDGSTAGLSSHCLAQLEKLRTTDPVVS